MSRGSLNNYGSKRVSGGSVSQSDNALCQLPESILDGLLVSGDLQRGLRRKIEKRLKKLRKRHE